MVKEKTVKNKPKLPESCPQCKTKLKQKEGCLSCPGCGWGVCTV